MKLTRTDVVVALLSLIAGVLLTIYCALLPMSQPQPVPDPEKENARR